jgi:hypothetical protein
MAAKLNAAAARTKNSVRRMGYLIVWLLQQTTWQPYFHVNKSSMDNKALKLFIA